MAVGFKAANPFALSYIRLIWKMYLMRGNTRKCKLATFLQRVLVIFLMCGVKITLFFGNRIFGVSMFFTQRNCLKLPKMYYDTLLL